MEKKFDFKQLLQIRESELQYCHLADNVADFYGIILSQCKDTKEANGVISWLQRSIKANKAEEQRLIDGCPKTKKGLRAFRTHLCESRVFLKKQFPEFHISEFRKLYPEFSEFERRLLE